jgi:hypothetical protein
MEERNGSMVIGLEVKDIGDLRREPKTSQELPKGSEERRKRPGINPQGKRSLESINISKHKDFEEVIL